MHTMSFLFSKTLNIKTYEQQFLKMQQFQYFYVTLINLRNDGAFVLAVTADVCSMDGLSLSACL